MFSFGSAQMICARWQVVSSGSDNKAVNYQRKLGYLAGWRRLCICGLAVGEYDRAMHGARRRGAGTGGSGRILRLDLFCRVELDRALEALALPTVTLAFKVLDQPLVRFDDKPPGLGSALALGLGKHRDTAILRYRGGGGGGGETMAVAGDGRA